MMLWGTVTLEAFLADCAVKDFATGFSNYIVIRLR